MKILATVTLLVFVLFCQAQDNTSSKTFFVKTKGDNFANIEQAKRVNSLDSADYIRTVSTIKNNENLYSVNEYYLDKTPKRIGNSLNNGFMPKYNGNVISYYKNGNIAAEELFVTGKQKGVSTYYYANKQLKKRVDYDVEKSKSIEKVLELNDSLGNHFLDAMGNGQFQLTSENGETIEGAYTSGLKDKTWKTVFEKGTKTYFDEYKDGEYVGGKTVDEKGKITKYDKIESLPTFKGGMQSFAEFLSGNLRYPSEARDDGVEGRVFLQFVIEKDGSLTEAKVVRGIGSGCDEEALRVISHSPKWNPGLQRGKAVRVSYTVPIFFKLGPTRTK